MIITIDGPAGSGKSTIARLLAEKLSYKYINSGLLYRQIALHTMGFSDPEIIIALSKKIDLNNIDEKLLRTESVDKQASLVASLREVRELVTLKQKELALNGNVVLEGRDAGTVVFPGADHKFYLTASLEERARRRQKDFQNKNLHEVKELIASRDRQDSERKVSPLQKGKDTIEIDTTGMPIAAVMEQIYNLIRKL